MLGSALALNLAPSCLVGPSGASSCILLHPRRFDSRPKTGQEELAMWSGQPQVLHNGYAMQGQRVHLGCTTFYSLICRRVAFAVVLALLVETTCSNRSSEHSSAEGLSRKV